MLHSLTRTVCSNKETISRDTVTTSQDLSNPTEIEYLLRNLAKFDFQEQEPSNPELDNEGEVHPIDMKKWEKRWDSWNKRQEYYRQNKVTTFATIWGQCSPDLQTQVKRAKSYEDWVKEHDCLSLLKEVKAVMFRFDSNQEPFSALSRVYCCHQNKDESNADYLDRFNSIVDVAQYHGATIGKEPALLKLVKKENPGFNAIRTKNTSVDRMKAMLFPRTNRIRPQDVTQEPPPRHTTVWLSMPPSRV